MLPAPISSSSSFASASPPLSPALSRPGAPSNIMGWSSTRGARLALLSLLATTLVFVYRHTGVTDAVLLRLGSYPSFSSTFLPPCSDEPDLTEETLLGPTAGDPDSLYALPNPRVDGSFSPNAPHGDQDFCPTGADGRPTVILVPIEGGVEPYGVNDPMNRTTFLGPHSSENEAAPVSDIGFLPWQPQPKAEAEQRRPRRFAAKHPQNQPCPVYYVPASSRPPVLDPHLAPPMQIQHDDPRRPDRRRDLTLPASASPAHACAAAPRRKDALLDSYTAEDLEKWQAKGHADMLFGFATTPSRALRFLPRWVEWLPSSLGPATQSLSPSARRSRSRALHSLRPHSSAVRAAVRARRLRRKAAGALVVVPPDLTTRDAAWEVVGAAAARGYDVRMKEVEAARVEERYFDMVRQLWWEGLQRFEETGVEVNWYVFADDDTYFLSLDSMAHMLSKYDPNEPLFVGSISESKFAIDTFGRIAFGGAGIFVSKGLMRKFNEPGVLDKCLERFGGTFGGDGMLSKCAAMVTGKDLKDIVTEEPALHQLDFKGEAHGVFSAGWRFASLHHWASWLQIQPRAHPHVIQDQGILTSVLGKAARTIGVDNWTRRYVFGMPTVPLSTPLPASELSTRPVDAAVVVSLGYSVTIFGKDYIAPSDLTRVERTYEASTLLKGQQQRPALLETKQRRTYYLADIRTAAPARTAGIEMEPQVAVMSHVNHQGEVIDLVWDARPRTRDPPSLSSPPPRRR